MIGYTSKASWDEIKINYKIDHGSIGVASRGILSAGPFQKSFTAGDDAQGCCGGRAWKCPTQLILFLRLLEGEESFIFLHGFFTIEAY